MPRPGIVAACIAALCGLTAGSAAAGLLPPLPPLPAGTTSTSSPLPVDTGGVTGTVGGVVDTTTGTVTGAIDTVLGAAPGSTGGVLDPGTLDTVLGTLLGGTPTGGTGSTGGSTSGGSTSGGSSSGGTTGTGSGGTSSGGSSSGGSSSGSAGSVVSGPAYGANDGSDHVAPALRFTILSKLRTAARTGKLRVRVHASEPAVVAFTTLIRPGRAIRRHGRPLAVRRSLIRVKPVVLAFRRAGNLVVVLRLPKGARTTLAHASNARLALQAWSSDLARNQARRNVKRTIR